MNEQISTAREGAESVSLIENQYVKELLSILQNSDTDKAGLFALIEHISKMEDFVKHTEDKIADIKSQVAEMKEVQNHPVKTVLQNVTGMLNHKVTKVKEQLSNLQISITLGCKNAISAYRDKGIAALDKLASFFHIKAGLLGLKKSIDSIIRTDEQAVATIEAFASEYHQAGLAIKNMARVAAGKLPLSAKKETGRLAAALATPYKAQKNALTKLNKLIDKAAISLDGLNSSAVEKKKHRLAERTADKKPSLLGQLQDNLALVEQMKREVPALERAAIKGAEL